MPSLMRRERGCHAGRGKGNLHRFDPENSRTTAPDPSVFPRMVRRGRSSTRNTDGDAMMCDMRVMAVVVIAFCGTAIADENETIPGAITTPHPTIVNLAV